MSKYVEIKKDKQFEGQYVVSIDGEAKFKCLSEKDLLLVTTTLNALEVPYKTSGKSTSI